MFPTQINKNNGDIEMKVFVLLENKNNGSVLKSLEFDDTCVVSDDKKFFMSDGKEDVDVIFSKKLNENHLKEMNILHEKFVEGEIKVLTFVCRGKSKDKYIVDKVKYNNVEIITG